MIDVGTDGSCIGGHTDDGWRGPGGWAWYVDDDWFDSGSALQTTNNIMELTAVRQALITLPGDLHIVCDSQYAIGCLTAWAPKWEAAGWKRKHGKAIKNLELVQETFALLQDRYVWFEHVRGHTGHELNEMADGLAGLASARVRDGR